MRLLVAEWRGCLNVRRMIRPLNITAIGNEIAIAWEDGMSFLPMGKLRAAFAECGEYRGAGSAGQAVRRHGAEGIPRNHGDGLEACGRVCAAL